MELHNIGPIAYLLGLIIAVIAAAAAPTNATVSWVLGVLGIIVGALNIQKKEVVNFLIAAIAFIVSASSIAAALEGLFAQVKLSIVNPFIGSLFNYLVVFTAPAAAVVALVELYYIARE